MRLMEFIFIDFWHWAGSMALLYVSLHFIVGFLNNFMYFRTVRKIGYPPTATQGESSPITVEDMEPDEQDPSNR